MAKPWLILARPAIYWLMMIISLGCLIGYSGLLSPAGTKAAFIFLAAPLLSWVLIVAGIPIAASGNNVYVAGRQIDTATSNWEAILWTNGVSSMLSADARGSNAGMLAIDGSDVYVGGNVGNMSAVWKNGQPFPMALNPSYLLYASSMGVVDGKLYMGGYALSISGNPTNGAAYWSEDGLVTLDKNPNQSSNVWGMFVK
jgi:hypothetical protein